MSDLHHTGVSAVSLDTILTQIWTYLHAAMLDDAAPFKTIQVATIGLDGCPNVRTVLLRYASERDNVIRFHTDMRSPKIAELTRQSHIALVGVAPQLKLQLRVFGEARILREGQTRVDAWNSSPDRSLIAYRTSVSPGVPIATPKDAFGGAHARGADEGLAHFCVVEVRPHHFDWLDESAADRPLRARFTRHDSTWESTWIAP